MVGVALGRGAELREAQPPIAVEIQALAPRAEEVAVLPRECGLELFRRRRADGLEDVARLSCGDVLIAYLIELVQRVELGSEGDSILRISEVLVEEIEILIIIIIMGF